MAEAPLTEAFASGDDIFGDSTLELTDAPASTSDVTPVPDPPMSGLGFVVEYGIPRDAAAYTTLPDGPFDDVPSHIDDSSSRASLDLNASRDDEDEHGVDLLTPPAIRSLDFGAELDLVPVTLHTVPTPDAVTAVIADSASASPPPGVPERRHTPRGLAVVMPSPASSPAVRKHAVDDDANAPERLTSAGRLTVHTLEALSGDRVRGHRAAPRIAPFSTSTKSHGMVIGGVIAACATALAGWFFFGG